MSESVFIETTIPSYYVARRPRDIVQAARQQLTIEWWDDHRSDYELLTSQVVVDEISQGESEMARKRLDMLAGVPLLVITDFVARPCSKRVSEAPIFGTRDNPHRSYTNKYLQSVRKFPEL
jgi:hypothetical protein